MKNFITWMKSEKRYLTLVKALILAALPILACLLYCALNGRSIGQVYLPNSDWNDELFYFKQVEGIVRYGYPQGYFGFNETHALKLSFAAWSPVLVFPWILWGLAFGWNLMSPILCNLVLLTLAMLLFGLLVRPTFKQLGLLTLLFFLYTPFVRYLLSGMPEIICFSMLIVFYSVALNYMRNERGYKLAILFVMAALLTLMRPYMLLFLLLPMFLWIRRNKWVGAIGSALILAVVLGAYAMIKHYLGAEYFAPLFFTDWITAFFERGLIGGLRNFVGTLLRMGKAFAGHTVEGFRSGLASGAFFGGYLVMMVILLWQSIADGRMLWKKRGEEDPAGAEEKSLFIAESHLALCFVGMLFALLLMYKLTEGSKHLLTFMAVGIFLVSLMRTAFYKKVVAVGAVFAYLYTYKAVDPYDYQVPFAEASRVEKVDACREALAEKMELDLTNAPSYENAVIWVLWDDGERGNMVHCRWQELYALPAGFGISCCEGSYVQQNFDSLHCRYIATQTNAAVDTMCREAGYTELYRDDEMVFYDRY